MYICTYKICIYCIYCIYKIETESLGDSKIKYTQPRCKRSAIACMCVYTHMRMCMCAHTRVLRSCNHDFHHRDLVQKFSTYIDHKGLIRISITGRQTEEKRMRMRKRARERARE